MNIDREADSTSIKLPELFNAAKVKEFNNIAKGALAQGCKELRVDFVDTAFIDSSGIGSLVALAKELKMKQGELVLSNLCGDIQELFEDTGLDRIFTIQTDNGRQDAVVDIFDTSVSIRLEVTEEFIDNACILHLSGVMNHPIGSHYFKQKFLLALAHSKKILLDFEELTFFDSLSVSILLNMNKLAKETGCSLRFGGANYIVNDLFSTLSIDKIIPCFESTSEALADWQ
ncbi:MAG: STAS domain-containing protein [Chitinivibrionales bacterium]|nr:STAS domain-containing protein [Chitinivibrionales bacterium]